MILELKSHLYRSMILELILLYRSQRLLSYRGSKAFKGHVRAAPIRYNVVLHYRVGTLLGGGIPKNSRSCACSTSSCQEKQDRETYSLIIIRRRI